MKKIVVLLLILGITKQYASACAYAEYEASYFNLLSQKIVQAEELFPFLRNTDEKFFYDFEKTLPDENILQWQHYFRGNLSYDETKDLVYKSNNQSLKSHPLRKKFESAFQYLEIALEIAPYAHIIPSEDLYNYYWYEDKVLNVSQLPYEATNNKLLQQYLSSSDPQIKLRYAYQIVRFHHYYRKYAEAVKYFDELVEPLGVKNFVYYLALEQKAGALSGLNRKDDANWAYFQVFLNTKSRKEVAFLSIKFWEAYSYEDLLSRAKSKEEKAGLWFLRAYDDFLNPIPFMQKIMEVDPESPFLKVLAIRSINEIERQALPVYQKCTNYQCLEDDDYIFPMPLHTTDNSWRNPDGFQLKVYAEELERFLEALSKKQKNPGLSDLMRAYLRLLMKDYEKAGELLTELAVAEPYIKVEAERLLLLVEILSMPLIHADFENTFANKYSHLEYQQNENANSSTWQFIIDVLANRYYRQDELAKSFLLHFDDWEMRNFAWDYLAFDMAEFLEKSNKTDLERWLLKGQDTSYLKKVSQLIIGDHRMLRGDFSSAEESYQKVGEFKGLNTFWNYYNPESEEDINRIGKKFETGEYNGFQNISALIFGYNKMECFECSETRVMASVYLEDFKFIPPVMNKIELAQVAKGWRILRGKVETWQ
jgi:hypothetical protein